MIRRWWRRVGPWATPTLVVVEVILVWSGLLALRTAVAVGVSLEVLLSVTVASRIFAGAREFRTVRDGGADVWQAAEESLALLVPRRLARLIVIEPRLWVCLGHWVTGRHYRRRNTHSYRYDAALRPLLWAVVALVVVEGTALDFVLAFTTAGSAWIWLSVGVHAYAIVGLLGITASFATRPHLLDTHALILRDGVFAELVVPYTAITSARTVRTSNFGRSGLKIDAELGTAILAHGDATVAITLDPPQPIGAHANAEHPHLVGKLLITVDAAADFTHTVNARLRPTAAAR